MQNTRRIVIIALMVSLGLIMHFLETMIPAIIFIPGAKLGLANIVSLIGLVLFGFAGGLEILILRILLGSLFAGSFMSIGFYLSLSGGILSFLLMYLVYTYLGDKFSIIGISVIGASFHNLGQISMAYLLIGNSGIFYYLPLLILVAVPTGVFIGFVSLFSLTYLNENLLEGGLI
jgi:heptaprenyl diphosphate synthase